MKRIKLTLAPQNLRHNCVTMHSESGIGPLAAMKSVSHAGAALHVRRIRKAADDGLDAIYAVVSSVFGDKLEKVLYGAAYTAMDSTAYEDESWTPKDAEDREMTLDMARLHLEALKGMLQMAEQNGHGNVN